MQVASALKMIFILLSIAGFYFSTHFLLENATAAMYNILKEDIYTKGVARHIWNYTIKYSHILKWNYRKNSNSTCRRCLKHLECRSCALLYLTKNLRILFYSRMISFFNKKIFYVRIRRDIKYLFLIWLLNKTCHIHKHNATRKTQHTLIFSSLNKNKMITLISFWTYKISLMWIHPLVFSLLFIFLRSCTFSVKILFEHSGEPFLRVSS